MSWPRVASSSWASPPSCATARRSPAVTWAAPDQGVGLTPVQVRVAASLVEKDLLTPDNYPLSMNALLAACNQTSNRHPVVDYDEHTVANALENLKGAGLARVVYSKGMRVDKYRHVLDEALRVDRPALAVLSVLMLRGSQTAAELRTRT